MNSRPVSASSPSLSRYLATNLDEQALRDYAREVARRCVWPGQVVTEEVQVGMATETRVIELPNPLAKLPLDKIGVSLYLILLFPLYWLGCLFTSQPGEGTFAVTLLVPCLATGVLAILGRLPRRRIETFTEPIMESREVYRYWALGPTWSEMTVTCDENDFFRTYTTSATCCLRSDGELFMRDVSLEENFSSWRHNGRVEQWNEESIHELPMRPEHMMVMDFAVEGNRAYCILCARIRKGSLTPQFDPMPRFDRKGEGLRRALRALT